TQAQKGTVRTRDGLCSGRAGRRNRFGGGRMTLGQSLRLEVGSDGVALLILDQPGESVNTLKAEFADQLSVLLDRIEHSSDIRAVVLTSAKKDSFLAGADIHMLRRVSSVESATRLSRTGQAVLDRLERLNQPCVA